MRRLLLVMVMVLAACAEEGAASGAGAGSSDASDDAGIETTTTEAPAECSPENGRTVDKEVTIEAGGRSRWFMLTSPERGSRRRPLVIDFHGLAEGATIHSMMTRYGDLVDQEGFVLVTPNGTGNPVSWNVADDPANDDLAFFDAIVASMLDAECVDPDRIYATGLSNGAMFTSLLACTRADVIAAAVAVDGATYAGECERDRAVPLQAHHGTADPILLFNGGVDATALGSALEGGGGDSLDVAVDDLALDVADEDESATTDLDGPGYPEAVRRFAENAGCETTPFDRDISDEVLKRTYDCPPGSDVEFYIVRGGGHAWPGSEFSAGIAGVLGYTTFDIDATVDGWAFMKRFTLDGGDGSG